MATAPSAIRSVPQDPEPAWLFPQPDAGALGACKIFLPFVAIVRPDLSNVRIMVNAVTYLPQMW
jgi:hypothetical protein